MRRARERERAREDGEDVSVAFVPAARERKQGGEVGAPTEKSEEEQCYKRGKATRSSRERERERERKTGASVSVRAAFVPAARERKRAGEVGAPTETSKG